MRHLGDGDGDGSRDGGMKKEKRKYQQTQLWGLFAVPCGNSPKDIERHLLLS
jgi:hypothetical protein